MCLHHVDPGRIKIERAPLVGGKGGGRPELALSFVGFPNDKLPLGVLAEVLAGMGDACARAHTAIVGGHTIADAEPKAGLAVVGSVYPWPDPPLHRLPLIFAVYMAIGIALMIYDRSRTRAAANRA